MKFRLTILAVFLMLTSIAQNNTITLSPEKESAYLINELEVFTDSSEKLTFDQLINDSSRFHSNAGTGKPGSHVYWVRLNIKSGYKSDVTFSAGSSWWDYNNIYLVYPDSSVKEIHSGLLRKKSERDNNDFAKFVLPAGKEIKYYARLSTSGYFTRMESVNVFFYRYDSALESERYWIYFAGILIGTLIGFAFYNLSFAFSNRDSSYVWYFIYLLTFAISFSGQMGDSPSYLTQFLLPEHPLAGLFLKRLSDTLAFISLIIFSKTFLRNKVKHPLLDKILLTLIIVLVAYNIFWLSGYIRSNFIGIILYLIAIAAAIITAIAAWKEGFRAARFFILGQVFVFSGMLIFILSIYTSIDILSFLPDTRFFDFVKDSSLYFFGGIEALIFSLALADRQKERLKTLVNERTLELNNSLETLKATQKQLIHSEKMASLGQLTSGIAHEIQNPLNFVNNFSEVNKEMIAELKSEWSIVNGEKGSGPIDELLNNIEANEEKINQHGKRADAIVKNMMQHSRQGTGQKQLSDINSLADEYLKIAYHGMRTKEKDFNATLKKEFDNSIDKINIDAQDIGRVLLNVYNNAFYAVQKRGYNNEAGFEATVTVSTKKTENWIEIKVADNGNGIPQNILDKIFQPFFTTKPTGQGTGLGLSLAYDIVKAHKGEIKVTTEEGSGTDFRILLPNEKL